MRLILTGMPASSRDSRRASFSASLIPAISTYSTRIRRRGSAGHAFIAPRSSPKGWTRVIGISFAAGHRENVDGTGEPPDDFADERRVGHPGHEHAVRAG